VEAGPADGPLVVLLHGFPEFWYGWRRQIEPLAAAGFRVLVPDQRGYGESDKPRGARAYNLEALAGDVVGLLDEAGRERATIVGHDWGAAVAWWVAIRHPGCVERLAVLNGPHPAAFRRFLRRSPRQMLRSWYMAFFQLPGLPETALRALAPVLLKRGLGSRGGAADPDEIARYREAWSRAGALTAMVNWYRALFRHPPPVPADLRVRAPVLVIWGARDRYLGKELAKASLAYCDRGELAGVDATHWVQHDEPERVNRLLLDFLSR
jgi:pimeloyl-ACP methyl ester carboxylesterase